MTTENEGAPADLPEILDAIDDLCAKAYDTTGDKLHIRKQTEDVAAARRLAYYILAVYRGWALRQIAKRYARDHTTVGYNLNKAVYEIEVQKYSATVRAADGVASALQFQPFLPAPAHLLGARERMNDSGSMQAYQRNRGGF